MIAFAAPDGTLLDTIADASFNETARATSIRPGTMWGEAYCGTNALGTSSMAQRAMTVHGGEHFFGHLGLLTCTAAPVFAPDGTLAGVLDASSDCRSRQQHTHALVSMAATQVENGLFRHAHRNDVVVAFHSRGEFLHTLNAGLLAIDEDGVILAANAQARFLLQGLPLGRGCRFEELFRGRFVDLIGARRDDERQRLEDRIGSVFAAKLHNLPQSRAVSLAAIPKPGFVADDPAVAAVVREVERAARRRLPILIRGETGTGKEQLARHAHQVSGRRGAFVPVNCASLPDTLVEAELFGHVDGAFTGARRGGSPGLVAESDGGTLFLDEIGDMKLSLQSVLLRLLDDWTVRPVGGGKRRQVDVQLVAATNVDLDQAIAAGRFRADLLYRINTIDVTLPALRDRADFAAIARRLLAGLAPHASIDDEALAMLAAQPWRGNIRELRAVLTRLTLVRADATLDAAAVARMAGAAAPRPAAAAGVVAAAGAAAAADAGSLRAVQRSAILEAYRATGANVSETARRLAVSRNTVYRAIGAARRPSS
jgi:transcriptional regulator of acetoin/glycerol metabolism